jgi:hypothetical protein
MQRARRNRQRDRPPGSPNRAGCLSGAVPHLEPARRAVAQFPTLPVRLGGWLSRSPETPEPMDHGAHRDPLSVWESLSAIPPLINDTASHGWESQTWGGPSVMGGTSVGHGWSPTVRGMSERLGSHDATHLMRSCITQVAPDIAHFTLGAALTSSVCESARRHQPTVACAHWSGPDALAGFRACTGRSPGSPAPGPDGPD